MNAKNDSALFETVVGDALKRMQEATSRASSYEVDRSGARWVVRRESRKADKAFPELSGDPLFSEPDPAG